MQANTIFKDTIPPLSRVFPLFKNSILPYRLIESHRVCKHTQKHIYIVDMVCKMNMTYLVIRHLCNISHVWIRLVLAQKYPLSVLNSFRNLVYLSREQNILTPLGLSLSVSHLPKTKFIFQ